MARVMRPTPGGGASRDNRKKARRPWWLVLGLSVLALGLLALAGYAVVTSTVFSVRRIAIEGNRHLSEADIVKLSGLRGGENLVLLSLAEVYMKLNASPWLLDVSLRKTLPDTLVIKVQETEPVAVLEGPTGWYIVDQRAVILERAAELPKYFLPVIVYGGAVSKPEFKEAVALAAVITGSGVARQMQRVEITGIEGGARSMSLRMDGVEIRVGEGKYAEKLAKLFELSGEIYKRMASVHYIDLRFADRVVVKPATAEKETDDSEEGTVQ